MVNKKGNESRYSLDEFKEPALETLRYIGRSVILDPRKVANIQQASTPAQLSDVIKAVIPDIGAVGSKYGDLRSIVSLIAAQYPD